MHQLTQKLGLGRMDDYPVKTNMYGIIFPQMGLSLDLKFLCGITSSIDGEFLKIFENFQI